MNFGFENFYKILCFYCFDIEIFILRNQHNKHRAAAASIHVNVKRREV